MCFSGRLTSSFPFLDTVEVGWRSKSRQFRANVPFWYEIQALRIFFGEAEAMQRGGGLAWVGVVAAVGFPQLWVSRLGRGV